MEYELSQVKNKLLKNAIQRELAFSATQSMNHA